VKSGQTCQTREGGDRKVEPDILKRINTIGMDK